MISFLINGIVWTIAIYFTVNEIISARDSILPKIRDIRAVDDVGEHTDKQMANKRYRVSKNQTSFRIFNCFKFNMFIL